jgi:hypothetical protein
VHILETPVDVKLSEMFRSLESVDDVVDMREGIFVSYCMRVEPSIIEDGANFSIMLGDKK